MMIPPWRVVAVTLIAGSLALLIWAPGQVSEALRNFLALGNLAIFLFAAVVLAWFFYAVILRRILRARRIANARMRRMMREARDRHHEL
jgi:heme exporter protein D